jgi:hypothetical protein
MVDLLHRFAIVAGVTLVPSLEEYGVLADKLQLHNMYELHYKKVWRVQCLHACQGFCGGCSVYATFCSCLAFKTVVAYIADT